MLPRNGDLHLHSTASDGSRTPAEVIRAAADRHLPVIALTDHDTLAGIAAAEAELARLRAGGHYAPAFVPGVELSVYFEEQEIHLLAYFPDHRLEPMQDFLAMQRRARVRRNLEMLAKLEQLGYTIGSGDIPASREPDRSWGRLHIASALVAKRYFASNSDAFHALLLPGRPAYVPRQKITLDDALPVIRACDGVAVVAHPQKYGWCPETDTNVVAPLLLKKCRALAAAGVDGIEAGHGDATAGQVRQMVAAAETFRLQYTAGSDDHGRATPNRAMYAAATTKFPERTAVVVCALIADGNGRYLFGRRAASEKLAGFYELPGGKVDRGESNEAALRREIEEELCLAAAIGRLRAVLWHDTADLFLALAVYDTVLPGGTPRLTVHDELVWLSPQEALASRLLPADHAFFAQLLDG